MHKNKTLTTFLAFTFGGLGFHRFYVHGFRDFWAWVHLMAAFMSVLLMIGYPEQPYIFTGGPFLLSVIVGYIETLAIGLTPDEKWDARHNSQSGKQSRSGWFLAVLLVLTMGFGTIVLVGVIARTFDLLYTGGSYG